MSRCAPVVRAGLLLLLFPSSRALAGPLEISPIPLTLDDATRSIELRVTNQGEEEAALQIEVASWEQGDDGVEAYQPASEIVVFPEMLRMKGGEARIVRVGYQGEAPGVVEKAYRLYLQELPPSTAGATTVRMIFRFGVPLFVKTARDAPGHTIERTWLSSGVLNVKVKNTGNTHLKVRKLRVGGSDPSGAGVFAREARGWYVLAGASAIYSLELPEADCRRAARIAVAIELADGGAGSGAELGVDAAGCARAGAGAQ